MCSFPQLPVEKGQCKKLIGCLVVLVLLDETSLLSAEGIGMTMIR